MGVTRESVLGTALVIAYRTLVLIEDREFHRKTACIPDISLFDDTASEHDGFAIRTKEGSRGASVLIPLHGLPGKNRHRLRRLPTDAGGHRLTMQIEEGALGGV